MNELYLDTESKSLKLKFITKCSPFEPCCGLM